MDDRYEQVHTRFLRDDERFMMSQEMQMPLVIEAQKQKSAAFLQGFVQKNSSLLLEDMARYGAVLLRGFDISTDQQFEQTILSVPQFHPISEAFMAEPGRVPVGDLRYVLHTNSIYKTGGTLYLGGFHTENYYSADVPAYIFFYCNKPSQIGGETGIISTKKVYQDLDVSLQQKLEQSSYFVAQWRVLEVAKRYGLATAQVEQLAHSFNIPVVGQGDERLILMYKPSVIKHPITQEKSLQINLFELPGLNPELRACFKDDYKGDVWFWHRFFWSLPARLCDTIEALAVAWIALFKSPMNASKIIHNKIRSYFAQKNTATYPNTRIGTCFNEQEVKNLAQSMRRHYVSCLWQRGDILLLDNRQVMHTGMPGAGDRIIRALIANPLAMNYAQQAQGVCSAGEREQGSIAELMRELALVEKN